MSLAAARQLSQTVDQVVALVEENRARIRATEQRPSYRRDFVRARARAGECYLALRDAATAARCEAPEMAQHIQQLAERAREMVRALFDNKGPA